ncbi:hypothetical protein [Stenotrophomonas indicatrix]|uniref:hypothetical protein n=1 Tax=Stenotrophomonas indicatrix TaxID=2045451 RepID=UPI0028A7C5DE|nr:hypothetical protein [Stenotrophomonas indicatrix]
MNVQQIDTSTLAGPEEVWVTIVDGEPVDASSGKCSMSGLPDDYEVIRYVRADLAEKHRGR